MNLSKTILVTRKLSADSLLIKWANKNKLNLIQQPFIEIAPIKNLEVPATDWIFFSSPQGVAVYLKNYAIQAKYVAALSSGTAKELEKNNVAINFVGDAQKSTEEIGQDFFKLVNDKKHVLFPISSISLKKLASQGNKNQVINWVCYETNLVGQKINVSPDFIVFTSPSNVDGYLIENKIPESTQAIAIGNTTKNQLEKLGFKNVQVPTSTEEKDLIACLEKVI